MTESHYKLRINLTDDCNYDQALAYCQLKFPKFAIVYETGKMTQENPHIHGYIITDIKNATLRKQIRLLLNAKGNKAYSLKMLDVDEDEEFAIEYLGYMMKQNEPTIRGIPEEVLFKARAYHIKVELEKKEKKENRKSRYTRIMNGFAEGCATGELNCDTRAVFDYVVEFLQNEHCTISVSVITSHCNTILLKHNPFHMNEIYDRVYDQLSSPLKR